MTTREPTDKRTIVVGASRGLSRGIATALAETSAQVIAVARTENALAELAGRTVNITLEVADATDPDLAHRLLDRYDPEALVLVAGASPAMPPAAGADLGDVLRELAHRRADDVRLGAQRAD